MADRTIVITGASDGIGEAAARGLRDLGTRVVIVGRSPEKTKKVARELDSPYYVADYTNLRDVRALASRLIADVPRIDVLAHNAGGIMGARRLTTDGNEMTLQVNHLAPFLLTNLLLEVLVSSKASIITTSSIASRGAGELDLEDPNLERGYTPQLAYSKTKLLNILFTRELHNRFHAQGIAAAAFHPGIVRTNFAAEFPTTWRLPYTSFVRYLFRSPSKGADTLIWLARTTPGRDWVSGEFYKDRRILKAPSQADVPKLAEDVWELSARLTAPT